jgi:hypothetical protein
MHQSVRSDGRFVHLSLLNGVSAYYEHFLNHSIHCTDWPQPNQTYSLYFAFTGVIGRKSSNQITLTILSLVIKIHGLNERRKQISLCSRF